MRISASLCTESFQRYGSSTPTLKMPPMGLRPMVARTPCRFCRRPYGHEAAACLTVGEEDGRVFTDVFHIEVAERAAAGVGNEAGRGIDFANLAVPQAPQLEETLLAPLGVGAAGWVLRVVGAGEIEAGGGAEIGLQCSQ